MSDHRTALVETDGSEPSLRAVGPNSSRSRMAGSAPVHAPRRMHSDVLVVDTTG